MIIEMVGEITAATVKEMSGQFKLAGNRAVRLKIESPGGICWGGFEIADMVEAHRPGVDIEIGLLAASMASCIAMAGRSCSMSRLGMLMLHEPWTPEGGSAKELRETADILDKISTKIAGYYVRKTGLPLDQIQKMMAVETWLTAAEALPLKFIDRITASVADSNGQLQEALTRFAKLSPALSARDQSPVVVVPSRYKHERDAAEAKAEYSKMKQGPARLAFFTKHKHLLFS